MPVADLHVTRNSQEGTEQSNDPEIIENQADAGIDTEYMNTREPWNSGTNKETQNICE